MSLARFALCLALVAWSCLLAAATERAQPLTALEDGPFREADLVVLGVVENVTNVRAPGGALGRQVARVRVERAFKGAATKGSGISVIVLGQRPTLDPSKPSVPYFRAGVEERFVLFLQRSPGGATYRMRTLFDTSGKAGAAKIRAVAAVAEMAAILDPDAKLKRGLELLLGMLKSRTAWMKAHAARELAWLAGRQPEAFDAKTRNAIRRVPAGLMTADQRYWLRKLFKQLAASKPERRPGARDEPPAQAQAPAEQDIWRRTFQGSGSEQRKVLVTRLFQSGKAAVERHAWWAYRRMEPSLRSWFLRTLGASRAGVTGKQVRALYAGEDDPQVSEAIVRTVGLLGGPEDVPWIVARTTNLALRRAALLALARIRDHEALAHLRSSRSALSRSGDADSAAWIAYLLSEPFAEAERRAGRRVGSRAER